jgi:tRNA A-37 threonylcarbamoyl transferase component Bud32
MGVVWRATDTTLGRDVAIKVLPALFAGDPERMARFEREARLLASLNHPHIASIYGVGLADGVRFLAMELVEGDDLAARIARGPVSVAEAIEMARQIAEALEAAHEKGVIHRDLKPANVKLTAEGEVKVLDFGLAKALEGETEGASDATVARSPTITSPMTAANVILGTAAYMSPEQARGKRVDRRADIWAFGCVVYECLSGRRAFAGETVSDTIAKVLERDPDWTALPGATPPRVRELLQRCLDKDPRHRLRDIGDARIALEEVLASRSSSGRLLLKESGAGTATSRGGPGMATVVVGLAGLLAGAALWSWLGPHAPVAETRCATLTMPADIVVQGAALSRDGGTLLVVGQPRAQAGAQAPPPRIYARRLDRYDFKEVAGTEGAVGIHQLSDANMLYMFTPIAPGSPQFRLAKIPYDGSAPATTVVELKNLWSGMTPMLDSGDLLTREGPDKLIRIGPGGKLSAPVKMDAGRPGVSSYTLGPMLPGDRAMLVGVIAYDARGWHYSVGVLDIRTGKVKIVEEDGGNPRYSPTGHLVFSRGDAILAVPFDLGRLEPRGTPVAVWSGLSTQFSFIPGLFSLSRDGSLFYRPGLVGGDRSLAVLDGAGKLTPWSSDRRAMDNRPELSPDGRRFVCSLVSSRGIDELWVSNLDTPSFQRIGSDPDADAGFYIWSPDGSRVAYLRSGKDVRDGIYVQGVDGGQGSLVFKHDQYVPVGWLPDGASMLVLRRGSEKGSLALLKLAGDAADTTRLHPIMTDAPNLFGARLSPDGRHIAYTSDETGTPNAYVVELRPDGSTGRPVQVRTDQAFELQWALNGSALYIRDQRNRIMKAPMPSGSALALPPAVEVCDLDKLGISLWTALPDGRMFAGLKNDNEGDLTHYDLVLNWTAELKRKMSGTH